MRALASRRAAAAACLSLMLAGTAVAQSQPGLPPDPLGQPVYAPVTTDWNTWWTAPEPLNELVDPLGNRRPGRSAPPAIAAPVDASVYRLWGLMPLQTQVLRGDETIFEVWVRPVDASRQAVVRVTLRTDGRTFLQARAGRGCCSPGISRRVDIDRELPRELRGGFRDLRADPLWRQPEHVLVQEEGSVSAVCVDGTAYDLMRVEARGAVHLRRSCDPAEIGSVANALRTLLAPAQGLDPRFDAAIKGGFGFANETREYASLQARGGGLQAKQGMSASAGAFEPTPRPVTEPEIAEDDPRAAVLAADRAFAARAQQVGAASAFREFMDPIDGRLIPRLGPPAIGETAIYAMMGGGQPEGGRLLWTPEEAFVAESGDFAATWGGARFVPSDPNAAERQGRYVTVWRKDEDGRWKGLIDLRNMPSGPAGAP
jgi:ketosteroid isomerase-like protein